MKKILTFLLACLTMFVVTACGKQSKPDEQQALECYRIQVVDTNGNPIEYAMIQLYTLNNKELDTCYQIEVADKNGIVDYYVPCPDRYAILVYDNNSNVLSTVGTYYTNRLYESIVIEVW